MKKRILSVILAAVMTVGMLVSAIPAVSAAGGALPFKDVPANEWYVDSVRFVWERGIMNGTSAKTFGPEESMTRGQIVT
ncbi:MAG: S-layer homology domain-containing protein, partial [Clostridia bacterium]|nr:S-layer homology domain-containing protein [Clostridia bacterium]